jgi:O-antigen/teichoic acid export membrane protein
MGQRNLAVRGLRSVGSARLLSQGVTWGLTAVTVRLLQPKDYGLVATSGLFTVLASMVMDGGLSSILISRRDLSARLLGAAVVGVLLLSLLLAGAIVVAAPIGAEFFRNHALAAVLRVGSLQLPLSALTVVPLAMLARDMEFGRIAVIQTAASIVQGLSTLALAYQGEAYWALMYGTLIGSAIRAAGLWASLGQRPALNWRLSELRPLFRSSLHIVGQRLLYFVSADFDVFLLGRLTGAVALGPYSLARTLSHTALDQIAGTVNQVTLPAFAAKSGDRPAQVAALRFMLSLTATAVFPLFWLLGAIAPTALSLLFGSRWSGLVMPFTAFTLILPLRTLYTLADTAIVGTGNIWTTFKNMTVWASIMMPVLLLGAFFGARGEAIAWAVGFPLVFLSAMHRISRLFETSLREMLTPLLVPAVCAASAAAAVEVLRHALSATLPPVLLLAIEMATAAGLYWLLIVRFGREHYDQLMGLVLQLLRR